MVNPNTQPTKPEPDSERVIVTPSAHMISSISTERPTARDGHHLQKIQVLVKAFMERAVPKWTFGRPILSRLKSLLTPVLSRDKPDARVLIVVTMTKERDIRVFVTRMVVTTILTDSEKPTSMAQVANTLLIQRKR